MAGYARRPGASPLSRTRSLVVPEGERRGPAVRPQSWSLASPAFYGCRRGSALPQLAGERGHSRPLPSRLVRFRPSVMCCVPSRVLASVGDADFGYGTGKCSELGPSAAHRTRFGVDKLEDLDQTNPFSFKELLKTKNLSLSTEDPSTNSRIYLKEASRHPRGLAQTSPSFQTLGYGLEPRRPFFEDLAGVSVLEEEDEWDGAYQSSTLEPTRSSRTPGSMSPYLSFLSTTSELARSQSLPPWMLSDNDSCVSLASPAGSPVTDFEAHRVSLGDRHLRTLQINYEALKEDNSKLRRKLNEVQSFSETQTEMVRILEWKLEAEMVKEESDFHDLKSVVQQVEQNLELMTKRAVKAENQVMKLKQEIHEKEEEEFNEKSENDSGINEEPLLTADQVIEEIEEMMQNSPDPEEEEEGLEEEDAGETSSQADSVLLQEMQALTQTFNNNWSYEGLRHMTGSELAELLDQVEGAIRDFSEELVHQLARRDELEFEKEVKNSFITVLIEVQNKQKEQRELMKKRRKEKGLSLQSSRIEKGSQMPLKRFSMEGISNILQSGIRQTFGSSGTDKQYLNTVIPYEKKSCPPSVEDLQMLTNLLFAMKEDNEKVPTLLTDYILKVLCPT